MDALSRTELLSLLRAAKRERERDWLLILVAFMHGLRASEITSLTAHAVRDGHLTVQRLKGALRTTQALVEHRNPLLNERRALLRYIEGRPANERLFPISRVQFWRLMRRHCRAAGIPQHKAHPHTLRHSVAMQTIKRAGIENVRQHLGHRSLSSTGFYLRVTDEAAGKAIVAALRGSKR